MENALKFLEYSAAALIFVLAMHLLLNLRNDVDSMVNSVKDNISDTDVIYESAGEVNLSADNIISYTDLCAILARPLDYDIIIIGPSGTVTYSKESYNYLMFDFFSIPSADYYERTYNYDSNSLISTIQYQAVN